MVLFSLFLSVLTVPKNFYFEQKMEELDLEIKRLQKDLENEKVRMEIDLSTSILFSQFTISDMLLFPTSVPCYRI